MIAESDLTKRAEQRKLAGAYDRRLDGVNVWREWEAALRYYKRQYDDGMELVAELARVELKVIRSRGCWKIAP